jgi:hypothetical protein
MTKHCSGTAHDFEKFDDATIYCRKCGEQRVMDVQALIAKLPQPIYMPCPGPHYPPWQPWRWNPTTITYGTIQTGNTVVSPNTDNVTYTVENLS